MNRLRQHSWTIGLTLAAAVVANAAGYLFNLWSRIVWYDEVIHGFTIFAITLPLGVAALGSVVSASRDYRLWAILLIASAGLAIGALWEVAEWTYDQLVPDNAIKGKLDTIIDLVADTVGAVLGGWLSVASVSNSAPAGSPSRPARR